MLDNITLENFKSFRNLKNLEFKPVTILCGTNSCGKSTILESILLLKQTLESRNLNQTVLLNGRLVRLGSLENIVYGKKPGDNIILNYQFVVDKNRMPLKFYIRELIPDISFKEKADFIISYEISMSNSTKVRSSKYSNQIIVKSLSFKVDKKVNNEIIPGAKAEIKLQEDADGLYEIVWENIKSRFMDSSKFCSSGSEKNIKVTFMNLFPGEIECNIDQPEKSSLNEVSYDFHRVNDILRRIVNSYTYLGPLREEPSRRYIYEDEIVEIGTKGENAAYLYLSEQENPIKNHYFYNKENDTFYEEKTSIKLEKALSKWFTLMNINEFKPELNNGIISLSLNSESFQSTRVNIADVGFGVSQIFPIVLEGLRMKKGSCLLLEQPEIHLHPNLQMQMADYFISLALSGKNVIAETHSDHIINRLVRRIIEDDTFNLKELIGIYFINSAANGSICEKIQVDDMKGIVNWPKDFFDQTSTEQEKIMIAGLKKRKAARNLKGDL